MLHGFAAAVADLPAHGLLCLGRTSGPASSGSSGPESWTGLSAAQLCGCASIPALAVSSIPKSRSGVRERAMVPAHEVNKMGG